jgi:hypothetical protein
MRIITVLLLLLTIGSVQGRQVSAAGADHWVGINLSGIADWSTAHPFADLFKTSRPWISQRVGADWGQGGDLALTPEGWVAALQPGQFAETLMMTADPILAQGMDGTYTILYQGEGQIAFRGSNVTILSDLPGLMQVDARPTEGPIYLQVVETNPDNPLRNIRFLLPGTESTYQTQPFNPVFLEKIAPFSALRFMDWMATNNATISTWSERPKPTDANYAVNGVPVELMVQLANSMQVDAWFNMPHNFSNDCIRQFATYVRDHLDPTLKVYIEYSNETWNGQFDQAWYVSDRGMELGLAPGDAFWSGLRYYSQRSVEIFTIWEQVFGGTSRLVRVLATQAANAWTAEQVAEWQDAYLHADAIAIAPYFSCDDPANPDTVAEISALSTDELLDRQLANVQPGGCAYEYMVNNASVAQLFGLELIAYEGGQHLAGYGGSQDNEQLTNLFIAANRHPRMGLVYADYLQAWQDLGLGTFMLFNEASQPSMFGSWGLLESITQDAANAPKYQAVVDFIAQLTTP